MSTRTQTHTSTHSGTLSFKPERQRAAKTYQSLSGALDGFESRRVNPILGTVISSELNLKDVLGWPKERRDPVIRDLAITSFVTVKGQHALTKNDLAELALEFNRLTNKPSDSGLHIHPLSQKDFNEDGSPKFKGEEITNARDSRGARVSGRPDDDQSQFASDNWHTDISFEAVPASYTLLRMNVLPESGGDTMFLSSYEAYDRLSKPYQTMLEGLTATHDGKVFNEQARKFGFDLYTDTRGNSLNHGDDLRASHPVIRTNQVTGWKSLHVNRTFTTRINELSYDESASVLDYLHRHKTMNHNLQARVTWEEGDLTVWDNSAVEHAATFDYDGDVARSGDRAVAVGEKPFLDAKSTGRREALKQEEEAAQA